MRAEGRPAAERLRPPGTPAIGEHYETSLRKCLATAYAADLARGVDALAGLPRAGPFVTIQGDQFVLNGQVYKLKGTNYYPQDHMWADMWSSWDWPAITYEVDLMHDLGLNCVRILVPYSNGGWNGPNVPADRLQKLEDIVNLMGDHGIRSVVTLFDWETSFPASGTSTWNNHLTYMSNDRGPAEEQPLRPDVGREERAGPPGQLRLAATATRVPCGNWDCNPAKRDQIVSWLHRMCDAVRARDPNHPVSAGMRWWENLPDVLSFEDVAIFHSYWPNIGTEEIPRDQGLHGLEPEAHRGRGMGLADQPQPLLPRRPADLRLQRDPAVQRLRQPSGRLHPAQHRRRPAVDDVRRQDATPTDQDESFEQYFGLWKYGYTLKPAGVYYRDNFPVSPVSGHATGRGEQSRRPSQRPGSPLQLDKPGGHRFRRDDDPLQSHGRPGHADRRPPGVRSQAEAGSSQDSFMHDPPPSGHGLLQRVRVRHRRADVCRAGRRFDPVISGYPATSTTTATWTRPTSGTCRSASAVLSSRRTSETVRTRSWIPTTTWTSRISASSRSASAVPARRLTCTARIDEDKLSAISDQPSAIDPAAQKN